MIRSFSVAFMMSSDTALAPFAPVVLKVSRGVERYASEVSGSLNHFVDRSI
jgi:hypothetical protein